MDEMKQEQSNLEAASGQQAENPSNTQEASGAGRSTAKPEEETHSRQSDSGTMYSESEQRENRDIDHEGRNSFESKPQAEQTRTLQISRHVIQVISFILFPALFFTVVSSISQLILSIADGSFTLAGMGGNLILICGILLITVFWGRFFCGYLCAVGAVSELIYYLSEKIMPEKWRISRDTDKRLKYVKYLILVLFAAGVWYLIAARIFRSGHFPGHHAFFGLHGFSSALTRIGLLAVIAFFTGSFFVERFFCRYLCPLGAVFTPLSKLRLFHVHKERETCSMGIDTHGKQKVTSGECINCMQCGKGCMENGQKKKRNPAYSGIAAAIAIALIVAASQIYPIAEKGTVYHDHKKSYAESDENSDSSQFPFDKGQRGNRFENGDEPAQDGRSYDDRENESTKNPDFDSKDNPYDRHKSGARRGQRSWDGATDNPDDNARTRNQKTTA